MKTSKRFRKKLCRALRSMNRRIFTRSSGNHQRYTAIGMLYFCGINDHNSGSVYMLSAMLNNLDFYQKVGAKEIAAYARLEIDELLSDLRRYGENLQAL